MAEQNDTKETQLRLDPAELTVGDMEDFEDELGYGIDTVLVARGVKDPISGQVERDEDNRPVKAVQVPFKAMKVLIWIQKRREDPEFTLEDARGIKVTELILGSEEDAAEAAKEGQGNGEAPEGAEPSADESA